MSVEQEPATPPPEDSPVTPTGPLPVVIPRNIQLVLIAAAMFVIWVAGRAAKHVVLLFIIASVLALLLNPVVSFLQRRGRLPRGLAIPAVYLTLLVGLVGVGFALSSPVSDQVTSFRHNVPHLVDQANKKLGDLQDYLDRRGIHVQLRKQGKTALQTLEEKIVKGSSSLVSFSGSLLRSVANAALSLVLILVLSIYMLVYAEAIGVRVRALLPPGDGSPEDNLPLRVQAAVTGYVRGQLIFSIAMGATAGVALFFFGLIGIFPDGRTYAVAFGVFFGVMELVPFVGPVLGALPPILVALFQDPLTAVWVALLFVGLQQLEGHIVAPQVFSRALRINPLLVIFALLFGEAIYGLVGAVVALPVAAVLRETTVYLRRHVVLEPWATIRP